MAVDQTEVPMERKRLRPNWKNESRSAPAPGQRRALLSPPPILPGEDSEMYEDLVARMFAAVKPVDIIEEFFVEDMVFLEWEILRLRRVKLSLLEKAQHKALNWLLCRSLDFELYAPVFIGNLTEILEEKLAKDEAQKLARRCARDEPDANEKVDELLTEDGSDMEYILKQAKAERAEELAQAYARRKPDAIKQVTKILASSGLTIDYVRTEGLMENIEETERIERLITVAESRRNASLRELGRHRAALGEALRQKIQEVEEADFEVIESKRKNV